MRKKETGKRMRRGEIGVDENAKRKKINLKDLGKDFKAD